MIIQIFFKFSIYYYVCFIYRLFLAFVKAFVIVACINPNCLVWDRLDYITQCSDSLQVLFTQRLPSKNRQAFDIWPVYQRADGVKCFIVHFPASVKIPKLRVKTSGAVNRTTLEKDGNTTTWTVIQIWICYAIIPVHCIFLICLTRASFSHCLP